MPRDTGNQLAEYAREEVGEALRTVVVVYEADFDVIYLRSDLEQSYSQDRYESVVDSFRIELRANIHDTDTSLIGPKQSIVHYHDKAYVFQFPHKDCHSILLSVEPRVGTQLQEFITACKQRI